VGRQACSRVAGLLHSGRSMRRHRPVDKWGPELDRRDRPAQLALRRHRRRRVWAPDPGRWFTDAAHHRPFRPISRPVTGPQRPCNNPSAMWGHDRHRPPLRGHPRGNRRCRLTRKFQHSAGMESDGPGYRRVMRRLHRRSHVRRSRSATLVACTWQAPKPWRRLAAGAPTIAQRRLAGVSNSAPTHGPTTGVAWVAQSVEQRTRNAQVRSSNLLSGSKAVWREAATLPPWAYVTSSMSTGGQSIVFP
jgi:hypothetical protein